MATERTAGSPPTTPTSKSQWRKSPPLEHFQANCRCSFSKTATPTAKFARRSRFALATVNVELAPTLKPSTTWLTTRLPCSTTTDLALPLSQVATPPPRATTILGPTPTTEAAIFGDALGDCGGSCLADEDGDGICDDVDECVGELDDCGVCNGPGAGYFCESDFDGLPIRITSTCGEDEFAPGLTDDFQVVLSASGT